MFLDFSVMFDRLGEQMAVIMIMLQRQAVQRQIVTVALILLLTALAPRVLRRLLRLWSTPSAPVSADAATRDAAAASVTWRSRIVRWLQAIDFILFSTLLLLFTYRAIGWYDANGWPSGLIEGLLPIFWLLFVYRLLVQLVLKALPKDQSERFATELLRPIVLILILLIARNLLFSTLGLSDISLLRLGDIVLNLGALLDGMIVILGAFVVGGAVRKALLNMMVHSDVEADVANTVSNVARYSVVGLGVLVAIGILGIELSALGWIAGGLVVGLGFGLQELFANFVSGIVLVFERIVRPGDVIELDGTRGSGDQGAAARHRAANTRTTPRSWCPTRS
ncbi:MAG: mechanosensitive ion channel domain-containing protein [Anaerolineae bacterium]